MEKNMIGKYLRDLRRRRGMSQQELALALGVSKQTISNWEVGRKVPRMKAVEKIANVFGVSRNSILAGLPVEMLEQEGQEDRKVVESLGVVWPNQKSWGTHINVSGAGIIKTAPNREAAIKFMEYLASDQAQAYFANGNNEWPAVPTVKVDNPALKAIPQRLE